MRAWVNAKCFNTYFFDFVFSYFSSLNRIINKCYKTKSLLFFRRPAVSKRRIRNYFQVNIQNLFNLIGISKQKKFKINKNIKKNILLYFIFVRNLKLSKIFVKSIKKLIIKLRKK